LDPPRSTAKKRHFRDRDDAGQQLAQALTAHRQPDTVVLGLARGGVPVAARVAVALDLPLLALVVRKVGHPLQPEVALGAIAPAGTIVMNIRIADLPNPQQQTVTQLVAHEQRILNERQRRYAPYQPAINLRGRTAIVVDDGVATGATIKAAIRYTRSQLAGKVVLAVPVCAQDTALELELEVNELICLIQPDELLAVGLWYQKFDQVSDADVIRQLQAVNRVDPD
jgi:putative phosphoribosyl transferase